MIAQDLGARDAFGLDQTPQNGRISAFHLNENPHFGE